MSKSVQRTLEAKLAALDANPDGDSSSSDEESEDESMEEAKENKDSSRKSTLRSNDAKSSKNKKAARTTTKDSTATNNSGSNVIYIGHLPRGFEESELKKLFQQFGKIVNLRLVRSKKTGNSRGYAFCRFLTPEVAAIVAETFSGYIVMGQHRLVCHVIASDAIHRGLFHKLPKLLSRAERRAMIEKKRNQQLPMAATKMKQITAGLLERERKKRDKMKELGIDYFDAFPGYEASAQAMFLKKDDTAEESATTTLTTITVTENAATPAVTSKKGQLESKKKKDIDSNKLEKVAIENIDENDKPSKPTLPSTSKPEDSKKASAKKKSRKASMSKTNLAPKEEGNVRAEQDNDKQEGSETPAVGLATNKSSIKGEQEDSRKTTSPSTSNKNESSSSLNRKRKEASNKSSLQSPKQDINKGSSAKRDGKELPTKMPTKDEPKRLLNKETKKLSETASASSTKTAVKKVEKDNQTKTSVSLPKQESKRRLGKQCQAEDSNNDQEVKQSSSSKKARLELSAKTPSPSVAKRNDASPASERKRKEESIRSSDVLETANAAAKPNTPVNRGKDDANNEALSSQKINDDRATPSNKNTKKAKESSDSSTRERNASSESKKKNKKNGPNKKRRQSAS